MAASALIHSVADPTHGDANTMQAAAQIMLSWLRILSADPVCNTLGVDQAPRELSTARLLAKQVL
jgi:hypothetical protein